MDSDAATEDKHKLKRVLTKGEFRCDKCDYRASYSSNLRAHSRTHSSGKAFECPSPGCAYRTRWAQDLPRHQRRCQVQSTAAAETSEEVSIVAVFDKRRSDGAAEFLMEGVSVAEGELLNSSTPIDLTSKRKYNQESHHVSHTDHKSFRSCPIQGCKYRTKRSHSLKQHSRRIHHIELTPQASHRSKHSLGPVTESKPETGAEVNSSSSLVFACMLCDFVGDSELSALDHARHHTAEG